MASKKNKGDSKPKASKKKKGETAAPASTAPVKVEPYVQQLACGLKREEVEERAQRAAHLLADRDNQEAKFDEERKAQKAVLQRIDNEIRSVSQEVREKVTYRDVKCERRYIYADGKVQDVRLDTGEVFAERAMSDAEKQRDLFDDGDEKKPGAGGAGGAGGDVDDEFGDDPEDEKKPDAAE